MLKTQLALEPFARALSLREDELIAQAIQALLERNLRQIEAQIFEISGKYGIASVEEMDAHYRDGDLLIAR